MFHFYAILKQDQQYFGNIRGRVDGWMTLSQNWSFRGCGRTVWKSRGDCLSLTLPGQKESQASVEFIFVQFRHCIRSSAQQATHGDRQTDSQTGQKGAPGRGNYHRKTKCSLLSIFFTSLLWRRWRNNLRLLSNCQVLPCGKSLHYVICEALEPWIKRQTQCKRQTETRDQTVTLLPVTAQRPPYLQRRRCSWHPVQPPNPSPSCPLKRIRSSKYIRSPQEASLNRQLSRLNIKDKKKRSSAFEGSPGAYGKKNRKNIYSFHFCTETLIAEHQQLNMMPCLEFQPEKIEVKRWLMHTCEESLKQVQRTHHSRGNIPADWCHSCKSIYLESAAMYRVEVWSQVAWKNTHQR